MTQGVLHQFVPTFEPGAVGAHMLQVRRLAHDLGLESECFAEHVHPSLRSVGRDFRDYGTRVAARPGDIVVYQTAIGSTVADFVLARPGRLVVNYHNITPERFFAPWEPGIVYGLTWGRAQVATMAERAELGVAVSAYNAGELVTYGYGRTEVVPILLDLGVFGEAVADPALLERLVERSTGARWLFVGRVAPNKAIEDLVKALAVYRRAYDPRATLRVVGAPSSGTYLAALKAFTGALGLDGAVTFPGGASDTELAAELLAAQVYVCTSDHEGFCVPLLEAMHHGLPIVAYGSTAVPETLGSGGLCLADKAPTTVAAAVARVLGDDALRQALVAAGHARLADFELTKTRARMADVIRSVLPA